MRSSNRDYLASVDHLRAFAALLIVFYHGIQLFNHELREDGGGRRLYDVNPAVTWIYEGHTAVTLFMVLSGFIFTVGTLGHGVSFSRFMGNRLLRIYPLFILLLMLGIAFDPGLFTLGGFLQTVLGLGNLRGALIPEVVGSMFWAVAIEMQFYLLFPLLNRMLTRYGPIAFTRLFAAIVVVRALIWAIPAHHDTYRLLYRNIAGRIDHFLLGMLAAWLFVRYRERFTGWWKVLVSVALAVGLLWYFNQAHYLSSDAAWRLVWHDVEGGVWALVILTYVATLRSTNLVSRGVAKIGELSYSIYLIHPIVIAVMIGRGWLFDLPNQSSLTESVLSTAAMLAPAVIAISFLTYYGVEQPFLRLRMRYLLPADSSTPRHARTELHDDGHRRDGDHPREDGRPRDGVEPRPATVPRQPVGPPEAASPASENGAPVRAVEP